MAGVFVLDRDRNPVSTAGADLEGFFTITAPGTGEYFLYVQRLGYFENESPLVAVEEGGQYGIDFELRPEPIRLDPLQVSVRNEELEQYLSLELGENPNAVFGYRVIQGIALEEAKLGAKDNTDVMRRLYIPVHWGRQVCVGWGSMGPRNGSSTPAGTSDPRWAREQEPDTSFPCGSLSVDGYRCPAEFLETIDLDRIAVVVTLGGNVRLYTRDFDWTFKPGFRTGAC